MKKESLWQTTSKVFGFCIFNDPPTSFTQRRITLQFVKIILNFTPLKRPTFQNKNQSLANTRKMSVFGKRWESISSVFFTFF